MSRAFDARQWNSLFNVRENQERNNSVTRWRPEFGYDRHDYEVCARPPTYIDIGGAATKLRQRAGAIA